MSVSVRTIERLKSACLLVMVLLVFSACSSKSYDEVNRLNEIAYGEHYRNLDSTEYYARKALELSDGYNDGRAEAYNNLAFCSMARMNYTLARAQLDSVENETSNQVELLIADIQRMRLCQRESHNKEFYDYRERARHRIRRITEEYEMLSAHERRRMIYANSDFDIVTSTYYYYVGLEQQSVEAINRINPDGEILQDTAQYLNYLYNVGAGGSITKGTQEEINQREFDYLMRCYQLSLRYNYPFWEANSMQAISEHLQVPAYRDKLIHDNLTAVKYLNVDNIPDSLLPGNLAQRSLDLFVKYGDVYQTAGAYRTLAQCYWQTNDYYSSLLCLQDALFKNTAIKQAPDLVASIREQLSVVYSAIDDKPRSDYNRNIYLDLQEQTRQDRYLEARADQLNQSAHLLNFLIIVIIFLIVGLVVLLFILNRRRKNKNDVQSFDKLLQPLEEWKHANENSVAQLNRKYEDICEETEVNALHIRNSKRRNIEQRAKVALVNSITPFIDRIINEIDKLSSRKKESAEIQEERYAYVAELTDKINDYNAVLTEWIQLRQGELNLHIESFPLQPLFDIVAKGRMGFVLKSIDLDVKPTEDIVKADKILTLFMINTMANNARKFTPNGGTVTISSTSADNYVEISIEDTGVGMTPEQLANVFKLKVEGFEQTKQSTELLSVAAEEKSHGFGLLNCRGIIDKYHKLSPLFNVCIIAADSKPGKGSRFFFRLPKGVQRALTCLLIMTLSCATSLPAAENTSPRYKTTTPVTQYADSAYYCNIRGEYARTLLFADSARQCLNKEYLKLQPHGTDTMLYIGGVSEAMAEINWLHKGLKLNYDAILDIRNESAVAALALHQWELYRYNNKVYTMLYKETSADKTLSSYVRFMQRSETNKNVAIIILVLLLLAVFPAYYFFYYRHKIHFRFCVEKVGHINDILLSQTDDSEKLHKIQSIATNRFPFLLQNIVRQIVSSLQSSIEAGKKQRTHIELAEDELRRSQYEGNKLHISNNVLDNCLSTLKHETMYYPSRIKQLVESNNRQLQSISEVASYYKELYTLLSKQAMRQVESVKMDCYAIPVEEIFTKAFHLSLSTADIQLLGDKEMLRYLFEILLKQSGEKELDIEVNAKDMRYVTIRVPMKKLQITDEECLNLFTPHSMQSIPYLLCRQIVRETGETTNARGCGIMAERNTDGGATIVVTLAKGTKTSHQNLHVKN